MKYNEIHIMSFISHRFLCISYRPKNTWELDRFTISTYDTTKLSSNETINMDLFMPISNTLMFALTFKILISICWFLRSKECKLCLPIPGVVVLWCMFWHLLKPHLDILNYLLCRSLEIYMYIYDAKILFEQRWHFLIHEG